MQSVSQSLQTAAQGLATGLTRCSPSHSIKGALHVDKAHRGLYGSKGQIRTTEMRVHPGLPSSPYPCRPCPDPCHQRGLLLSSFRQVLGTGTFPLLQLSARLETPSSQAPPQAQGNTPGQGDLPPSYTPEGHSTGQPSPGAQQQQPAGLRQLQHPGSSACWHGLAAAAPTKLRLPGF